MSKIEQLGERVRAEAINCKPRSFREFWLRLRPLVVDRKRSGEVVDGAFPELLDLLYISLW